MAGLTRLGLATPRQLQPLLHRRLIPARPYGSAAALQYDDYYTDEEEEIYSCRKISTAESAAGWLPERGVQWLLIGEPGAKKHVYAEKLSKLLEVPHISMGTLLRQELNPNSSLYKKIENSVNEGKLVPEDVIFGLLSKRLEEGYFNGENGFILDGIPRTRMQAEVLDQIADIDLVVNLKCTPENYVKWSLLRPGKTASSVADMQNAANEKLRIYAEQGKALEDYYRKQKKLIDVQVTGAPTETWQGLLAALHLKHLNAVTSSQKLVA